MSASHKTSAVDALVPCGIRQRLMTRGMCLGRGGLHHRRKRRRQAQASSDSVRRSGAISAPDFRDSHCCRNRRSPCSLRPEIYGGLPTRFQRWLVLPRTRLRGPEMRRRCRRKHEGPPVRRAFVNGTRRCDVIVAEMGLIVFACRSMHVRVFPLAPAFGTSERDPGHCLGYR